MINKKANQTFNVKENPSSGQYDVLYGDELIDSWRKSDDANAHCYSLRNRQQAWTTKCQSCGWKEQTSHQFQDECVTALCPQCGSDDVIDVSGLV